MKIGNCISNYSSLSKRTQNKREAKEKSNLNKENGKVVYEKGQQQENNKTSSDYSHLKTKKYTIDKSKIERMKMELDERMKSSFLKMAKDSIGNQNTTYKTALEAILKDKENKIQPEMIEQAKIDVSEGGYWSASKTADRILEFAKTLSGGNPEKADMLKEAFLKGFEEAEKAWGGSLPEISQKTKDAVLEGFENWKDEMSN
ncbi:hypothetical protein [Maledivibacter halophilus]|uniref:Uncharacterized protein n=1 Tax=Maledivibacter halophilus TaxID=36842 RepID=A0A1T5M6B3_9FIRM|nr:hypothetical protein [Maledivibacter halophilus]SKC83574.1 hypothetical protein SAMN02194393_03945 [Maledivibacter halophilus]